MADAPNRIRELRMAAGKSQQRLGDEIGVSKMTVSDLERGEMELTVNYMRRIARALSVMPADLLSPNDNPDALDQKEREWVSRYREASSEQKETFERVTEAVLPYKAPRRVA